MYFLFFMLLLALFSIIYTSSFPYRDAKLLPMLMSIFILVMMIIEIIREFRTPAKDLPEEKKTAAQVAAKSELSRLAILVGWTGGFLVVAYLIGFMITTPLFMLSFLKCQGRSWLLAVTFTAAVSAAIYAIFVVAVGLSLPEGILFQ